MLLNRPIHESGQEVPVRDIDLSDKLLEEIGEAVFKNNMGCSLSGIPVQNDYARMFAETADPT